MQCVFNGLVAIAKPFECVITPLSKSCLCNSRAESISIRISRDNISGEHALCVRAISLAVASRGVEISGADALAVGTGIVGAATNAVKLAVNSRLFIA